MRGFQHGLLVRQGLRLRFGGDRVSTNGAHEISKERVWLERFRTKLGVKLDRHEPRMV